jgi:hypothetical protein
MLFALPVSGQNPRRQIVLLSGQKYSDVSIDSLYGNDLIFMSAGITLRIPLDSISQVNTLGSAKLLRGVSIGLLAGAAAGFIVGLIIDGANEKSGEPILHFSGNGPPDVVGSTPPSGETNYKVILPIAGGVLGGSIGAIAGSSGGGNQIDLAGQNVEEKRRILLSLIHKAEHQEKR